MKKIKHFIQNLSWIPQMYSEENVFVLTFFICFFPHDIDKQICDIKVMPHLFYSFLNIIILTLCASSPLRIININILTFVSASVLCKWFYTLRWRKVTEFNLTQHPSFIHPYFNLAIKGEKLLFHHRLKRKNKKIV